MTNTNEQTLSTELEDALLNDDHDPKEKTPTTAHQDPMFSMLQNVNKTLGAMADSIINMNHQALKRRHPSNTDDQLDPKRRKYSAKDVMSALMVQMKMEMTRTRNFRAFVALKPIKLPR